MFAIKLGPTIESSTSQKEESCKSNGEKRVAEETESCESHQKKIKKPKKSDAFIECIDRLASAQSEQFKAFMTAEIEREKRDREDERKRIEEERAHELKMMALIMQQPPQNQGSGQQQLIGNVKCVSGAASNLPQQSYCCTTSASPITEEYDQTAQNIRQYGTAHVSSWFSNELADYTEM